MFRIQQGGQGYIGGEKFKMQSKTPDNKALQSPSASPKKFLNGMLQTTPRSVTLKAMDSLEFDKENKTVSNRDADTPKSLPSTPLKVAKPLEDDRNKTVSAEIQAIQSPPQSPPNIQSPLRKEISIPILDLEPILGYPLEPRESVSPNKQKHKISSSLYKEPIEVESKPDTPMNDNSSHYSSDVEPFTLNVRTAAEPGDPDSNTDNALQSSDTSMSYSPVVESYLSSPDATVHSSVPSDSGTFDSGPSPSDNTSSIPHTPTEPIDSHIKQSTAHISAIDSRPPMSPSRMIAGNSIDTPPPAVIPVTCIDTPTPPIPESSNCSSTPTLTSKYSFSLRSNRPPPLQTSTPSSLPSQIISPAANTVTPGTVKSFLKFFSGCSNKDSAPHSPVRCKSQPLKKRQPPIPSNTPDDSAKTSMWKHDNSAPIGKPANVSKAVLSRYAPNSGADRSFTAPARTPPKPLSSTAAAVSKWMRPKTINEVKTSGE